MSALESQRLLGYKPNFILLSDEKALLECGKIGLNKTDIQSLIKMCFTLFLSNHKRIICFFTRNNHICATVLHKIIKLLVFPHPTSEKTNNYESDLIRASHCVRITFNKTIISRSNHYLFGIRKHTLDTIELQKNNVFNLQNFCFYVTCVI